MFKEALNYGATCARLFAKLGPYLAAEARVDAFNMLRLKSLTLALAESNPVAPDDAWALVETCTRDREACVHPHLAVARLAFTFWIEEAGGRKLEFSAVPKSK